MDLPGYGKSAKPEEPSTQEGVTDVLGRWLPKVIGKGKKVVVLGHSMAGVYGLRFVEKYPQLVRAFINMEGNISLADCDFSGKMADYTQKNFSV